PTAPPSELPPTAGPGAAEPTPRLHVGLTGHDVRGGRGVERPAASEEYRSGRKAGHPAVEPEAAPGPAPGTCGSGQLREARGGIRRARRRRGGVVACDPREGGQRKHSSRDRFHSILLSVDDDDAVEPV